MDNLSPIKSAIQKHEIGKDFYFCVGLADLMVEFCHDDSIHDWIRVEAIIKTLNHMVNNNWDEIAFEKFMIEEQEKNLQGFSSPNHIYRGPFDKELENNKETKI